MLLDGKTSETNFRRFVERAVNREAVYYLSNSNGVATSNSNDEEDIVVLPFWSDAAYAKRAATAFIETYNVTELSLFELLYRWLPGMTGDGVLVGVNWNGELSGREIDPFELRDEIESKMSDSLRDEYEKEYERLSEKE